MSNARRRTRRIPRERATAAVVELLETICAGHGAAGCVTAVYAFGSWSRGALEVGDVDLDIEYDHRRDPEISRQMIDALVAGRDPNAILRKGLKPRRLLQVLFESINNLTEPVLLYRDGDDLDAALVRVKAITPDATAGRAERDPVHPVLEPVADSLSRPSLIVLGELVAHGHIEIEVVDLPEVEMREIASKTYRDFVADSWAEKSPLARAARAGGVLLLSRGLNPSQLVVLGRRATLTQPRPTWVVEAREGKLRDFAHGLGHGISGWLYVVRPERRRPLRGLELTAPANSILRDGGSDLDVWLAENAPHIQRVGAPGGGSPGLLDRGRSVSA